MKYLKLYEATSKSRSRLLSTDEVKAVYTPLINWDLINDAKDMSLEYLDEGLSLKVQVIDMAFKIKKSYSYVYSI